MTSAKPSAPRFSQALKNLHGLIICANSATYLWPLSRANAPFELMPDVSGGPSPLAKTIAALRPACKGKLIIATPQDIAQQVQEHISDNALCKPEDYELLIEPRPRGTALTCALAAASIRLSDPHATLLCLPASFTFEADSRWEQVLRKAHQVAEHNKIAVIGSNSAPLSRTATNKTRAYVAQNYDETKDLSLLSTISLGTPSKEIEGVFHVRSFVTRLAPAVAWRAQQSRSLWSTPIFMLKADLALAQMRKSSESDDPLLRAVARIAETARFFVSLGDEHWGSREAIELLDTLPALSFEEAVFGICSELLAVPTSIEFMDFTSLAGYECSVTADVQGNRQRGNALAIETQNTTVLADADKLVVTLGVEDALVIDTPDATLIASKQALASMPSVVAALRNLNAPEL